MRRIGGSLLGVGERVSINIPVGCGDEKRTNMAGIGEKARDSGEAERTTRSNIFPNYI